jgi:hypothetical protein
MPICRAWRGKRRRSSPKSLTRRKKKCKIYSVSLEKESNSLRPNQEEKTERESLREPKMRKCKILMQPCRFILRVKLEELYLVVHLMLRMCHQRKIINLSHLWQRK